MTRRSVLLEIDINSCKYRAVSFSGFRGFSRPKFHSQVVLFMSGGRNADLAALHWHDEGGVIPIQRILPRTTPLRGVFAVQQTPSQTVRYPSLFRISCWDVMAGGPAPRFGSEKRTGHAWLRAWARRESFRAVVAGGFWFLRKDGWLCVVARLDMLGNAVVPLKAALAGEVWCLWRQMVQCPAVLGRIWMMSAIVWGKRW